MGMAVSYTHLDEQIHNLLEKKAAGGELSEQENALLNIFCTAAELDRANASAKMNTLSLIHI